MLLFTEFAINLYAELLATMIGRFRKNQLKEKEQAALVV